MDAIRSYLDNMFAHLPRTEELRRAKEELLQMMEDKYHQLKAEGRSENEAVGQVISEFGNLEEVAEQLGIAQQIGQDNNKDQIIAMNKAEVDQYLADTQEASKKIAGGVMLIICAVIPLLILRGLAGANVLEDKVATALGIAALFIAIAIGVYNFIVMGIKTEKYEQLEKVPVDLDQSIRAELRNLKDDYRPTFARSIGLGVVLILVGVLVLTTTAILELKPDYLTILAVALLLLLVSIATYLFITSSMRSESYDTLLNEGEYTKQSKQGNKFLEAISGPYWMFVTVIYLAWSFIKMAWGISWIVFPIAGVLFGLIGAVAKVTQSEK